MEKQYQSLKEFYPYYLTEHLNPVCRALHFYGTAFFILLFIGAFATGTWQFFIMGPIVAYGFAWIGHFFFEKNKPATFQYPRYSLASDFIMFWHTITFQMPDKIAQAKEKMKVA